MEIDLTYCFKDHTKGFNHYDKCYPIFDKKYISIKNGILKRKQNFDFITVKLILRDSFPKGLFKNCYDLVKVEFKKNDLTVPIDFSSAFEECYYLSKFDISNVIFSNVTNTNMMFKNCEKLKAINLENLSFENTISADSMFEGCNDLAYIKLCTNVAKSMISIKNMFFDTNIIKIDTSFLTENLTDAEYAFSFCNKLKKINLNFLSEGTNINSILFCTNAIAQVDRKKINVINKKADEMNGKKIKFSIIEI